MLQYRAFFKDCLDLAGMPIAYTVCTSFDISRDLMTTATSTIYVQDMPTNVKVGDIVGVIDPDGTIMYTGVVQSMDESISARQMLSIFDDNWRWHDPEEETTIEGKIRSIIQSDFINSSDTLLAQKFPFDIVVSSQTEGTFEQHTKTEKDGDTETEVTDLTYIENFEELLNTLYDTWGVIVDIKVPYEQARPTITLKQATKPSVKIGNNALIVRDMTPTTEIFEKNKLVIYNKDGTELRATYYATSDGIVQDDEDPLRLPVINTTFIFSDEESLDEIVEQNLQEQMYNHKVTFSLIIDNDLYDFYNWELGMPLEIWYNNDYYDTLFTAYRMSKTEIEDLSSVEIVCGKVRNKLTEILNKTL